MKIAVFKKLIISVGVGVILTGCVLIDSTGLNPNAIKGSEASGKIINAALIADLVSPNSGVGLITILADVIAGIDSESYYTKSSVEDCEKSINGIVGYVTGSLIANVIKCDIEKDPTFIKIGPVGL